MLKSVMDTETAPRPEITKLIERLQSDGRRWARAETALAKAELGELKGQAIRFAISATVAFAATFCALVAFSQAGVAFLTPYVDSVGLAALIVGAVLMLLVVLSVLVMRSALSWSTESIFFRWFTRRSSART